MPKRKLKKEKQGEQTRNGGSLTPRKSAIYITWQAFPRVSARPSNGWQPPIVEGALEPSTSNKKGRGDTNRLRSNILEGDRLLLPPSPFIGFNIVSRGTPHTPLGNQGGLMGKPPLYVVPFFPYTYLEKNFPPIFCPIHNL